MRAKLSNITNPPRLPLNRTCFPRFPIPKGAAMGVPKAVEKAAGMIAEATSALYVKEYGKVIEICKSLRREHGWALRKHRPSFLAEADFLSGQAFWWQRHDGPAKKSFERAKKTDSTFLPMEIDSWLNLCRHGSQGSR